MKPVNISKSSNILKYDDDVEKWEADILFNVQKREIVLQGTTRELKLNERNNIITELLNTYCFGNYFNKEEYLYLCKLKNRGREKYEKYVDGAFIKTRFSYSILAEKIIELPKIGTECEIVQDLISMYLNLKIATQEDIIPFEFTGTSSDFNMYYNTIKNIKSELEYALSMIRSKEVILEIKKSKLRNNKGILEIKLKEA